MDYAIILSALEEVSDTNGELASVTSIIGIAGVTVDKTVVVADVEADDVEEINGYSAAEHNVETSVLIFIIIVVDFGTSALRHFDKLSDRRPVTEMPVGEIPETEGSVTRAAPSTAETEEPALPNILHHHTSEATGTVSHNSPA